MKTVPIKYNINEPLKQSRDTDDKTISSDDAACETAAKRALNESSSDNVDDLFFGSIRPMIEIATLHPTPAQVFKLWQIYLENVDPLLKITHTPTLQRRLVDAASNLASIPDPNLEALMFGIYCISVLSLAPGDCRDAFGSQKEVLSMRFQRGCQQALSKCRFIRTTNRDCLCALFLYLVRQTTQEFLLTDDTLAFYYAPNRSSVTIHYPCYCNPHCPEYGNAQ